MEVRIEKSRAKGTIFAPPSKSMAHRYIICAALSQGESLIENVDYSQDILATIDCVRTLGAEVKVDGSTVFVKGADLSKCKSKLSFMCRESGSTMRFFMGIAMCLGCRAEFFGSQTLRNRPFGIYEDICDKQGLIFERHDDSILIEGKISAGEYEIAGNISSQFITGIMYLLPLFDTDSMIKLIPPVESKSYLDLTLQAMADFGVDVRWENGNALIIPGGQSYKSRQISVEGDYSNAAFLEALNFVGGDVLVDGLKADSLQGDKVYKTLFNELKNPNKVIDISDCPDLGPILFAVAAAEKGGKFTGTRRLRIKESDRGTVMCQELSKFGIESKIEENDIEIISSGLQKPVEDVCGHNDHRIVMALSTLLTLTGGRVTEAEAVRKSYPGYFDDIKSLGIEVESDGMDK